MTRKFVEQAPVTKQGERQSPPCDPPVGRVTEEWPIMAATVRILEHYEDAGPAAETRTLVVDMSDPHVLGQIEANVMGMLRKAALRGSPN